MIRLILLSNELTKYMPTHLSDVEEFAAERKDAETVPSQHLEPSHRERLSAVALRQDERAVPQVLLLFHIHSFIHSFIRLFVCSWILGNSHGQNTKCLLMDMSVRW